MEIVREASAGHQPDDEEKNKQLSELVPCTKDGALRGFFEEISLHDPIPTHNLIDRRLSFSL